MAQFLLAGLFILPFHRIDDAQMRADGELPPLLGAQIRRTPGLVDRIEPLHGRGQQAVAGAARKTLVESRVQVAVALFHEEPPLLVADDDLELVELFQRTAAGRQPRYGRFHDAPKLHDLIKDGAFRVHGRQQRLFQKIRLAAANVGPVPVAALQHALLGQRAYGRPYAVAGNPEGAGQAALRRQLVAGLELQLVHECPQAGQKGLIAALRALGGKGVHVLHSPLQPL